MARDAPARDGRVVCVTAVRAVRLAVLEIPVRFPALRICMMRAMGGSGRRPLEHMNKYSAM